MLSHRRDRRPADGARRTGSGERGPDRCQRCFSAWPWCPGLALVTSGFTKNAEAAQITSMPVMLLLFASMGIVRQLYPEAVTEVIDRTPFALIFDLAQYGWAGNTMVDRIAADGAAPLESGAVLGETWQMMLILAVWAAVCLWAGAKYVRWDVRH
jgi:ABC-2 type transport system permease protein